MKKISVCLTTYNGEAFLTQQLNSILKQLSTSDEIIISDDGSTDKTLQIIESYSDRRIKLLHHLPQGYKYKFSLTTKNFENALIHATGDYIFFADQDDIWKENKVQVCVEVLKQGYDLVLHDAEIIDEKNEVISESYFKINSSVKGISKNLINNSYLGCCMAITSTYLHKALPFPNIPVPHDMWIGLLYEYYGKVIYLEKILLSYRRHGNNVSQSAEQSRNNLAYKLKYRAIFLLAYLKRLF